MTLDEVKVQAMINATVAPIAREQKRQRRKTDALSKRVENVEQKADAALQVVELVQQVLTEGIGRIELKMDKNHAEIVQRLTVAEGWIGRRRRIETAAVRLGQLAVVAWVRRVFPFMALWLVLVVTWWVMVMAIRG